MSASKLFLVFLVSSAVAVCAAEAQDSDIAARKLLTKKCGGHHDKPDCCLVWDWKDCYCRHYKDGYYYEHGKCRGGSRGDDDDDGDYSYKCPDCCKECDYYAKRCKEWKADWVYKSGKCEYKPHYKCPECCAECDYEHGYCKWYKPGYYYEGGRCYKRFEPKWRCPECCEWCDYERKTCKEYKKGWYYDGGKCSYRPRSTAEAAAKAKCFGRGCDTKTYANTLTTSTGSHSSSYASSSIGK